MCLVAGVVLASCATATVTVARRLRSSADSISVPLSSVACTTDDSCVAIGTSNLDGEPTSSVSTVRRTVAGRHSRSRGDTSTYVATSSCWSDGCVFVGYNQTVTGVAL